MLYLDWAGLVPENRYTTHMIGKWHLGACDERYLPTFRGFDSYEGYLSGGQSYYDHTGDRAGNTANALPACMGPGAGDVNMHNYSTSFWTAAASRIIAQHDPTSPLFMCVRVYKIPPMPGSTLKRC